MKQLSPEEFEDRKRHLESLRHVMPLLERNNQAPVAPAAEDAKKLGADSQPLKIQIDMNQIIEDDKYDDILDELLSDGTRTEDSSRHHQQGYLNHDDLDMLPSPTFEGFWNSGDDEDGENNGDAVNVSKLIMGSTMGGENKLMMSPGGKSDVSAFAENVLGNSPGLQSPFSPNKATSSSAYDILPTRLSGFNNGTNDHPMSPARAQFTSINYEHLSPDSARSTRKQNRRQSTGCIPETTAKPSHVTVEQAKQTSAKSSNGPMFTDDDILNLQPSASTESLIQDLDLHIKPTESTQESLEASRNNDSMHLQPNCSTDEPNSRPTESSVKTESDIGNSASNDGVKASGDSLVGNGTEAKFSAPMSTMNLDSVGSDLMAEAQPIESTMSSLELIQKASSVMTLADEVLANDAMEIKPAVSTTSSADLASATSNEDEPLKLTKSSSTESPGSNTGAMADPHEWAYDVWRRLGLMAGTPTDQKRPDSGITPPPSNKAIRCSIPVEATNNADDDQAKQPVTLKRRNPKDRQSLPAKMTPSYLQQPQQLVKSKPRNGAGFSILLSKWKGQSDSNPNAHFLSPTNRDPTPVRSKQAQPKVVHESQGEVTIDRAPEFSPSRERKWRSKSLGRTSQRSQLTPKKVVLVSPQSTSIASVGSPSIDAAPALSPSIERRGRSKSLGRACQTSKKVEVDNDVPPPSKLTPKKVVLVDPQTATIKPADPVSVDTASVLSPSQRRSKSLGRVNQKESTFSGNDTESQSRRPKVANHDQTWPTPSKTKNALARYLEQPKPTSNRELAPVQSYVQKARSQQVVKVTGPIATSSSDKISPTSRTSTIPFLSPADDSLLDPRDVMRHRRQASDHYSTLSKTSSTTTPLSVPCKEIFIFKDDYTVSSSLGHHDDLTSVAAESQCYSSGLPGIMETKIDSMSFDSKSHATHLSSRIETLRKLDSKVSSIVPGGGSERPWNKDLIARHGTATANHKVCNCDRSLAMFSDKDEMVEFFLPLVTVTCHCRKTQQLVNAENPVSLENILRPWQIQFLKNFGIVQGDQLVKAHHRSSK